VTDRTISRTSPTAGDHCRRRARSTTLVVGSPSRPCRFRRHDADGDATEQPTVTRHVAAHRASCSATTGSPRTNGWQPGHHVPAALPRDSGVGCGGAFRICGDARGRAIRVGNLIAHPLRGSTPRLDAQRAESRCGSGLRKASMSRLSLSRDNPRATPYLRYASAGGLGFFASGARPRRSGCAYGADVRAACRCWPAALLALLSFQALRHRRQSAYARLQGHHRSSQRRHHHLGCRRPRRCFSTNPAFLSASATRPPKAQARLLRDFFGRRRRRACDVLKPGCAGLTRRWRSTSSSCKNGA